VAFVVVSLALANNVLALEICPIPVPGHYAGVECPSCASTSTVHVGGDYPTEEPVEFVASTIDDNAWIKDLIGGSYPNNGCGSVFCPAGTISLSYNEYENKEIGATACVGGEATAAAEASFGFVKGSVSYTGSFQVGGSYSVIQGSSIGTTFNSTPVTLGPGETLTVTAAVYGVKASASYRMKKTTLCWMVCQNLDCEGDPCFATTYTYEWTQEAKSANGQKSSMIQYLQDPQ